MKKRILSSIIATIILTANVGSVLPVSVYAKQPLTDTGLVELASSTYYDELGLYFDAETGTITSCDTTKSGELTIPAEIGGVTVTSIGEYAFKNCTSLSKITIPNNVTSIEYGAFYKCKNLVEITLPNSITSIEASAFYSSALTQITIPEDITSIKDGTFNGCKNLTEITMPKSVTSIGERAFYNCTSLNNVYFTGSRIEWNRVQIGENNDSITKDLMTFGIVLNEEYYEDSGFYFDKSTGTITGYEPDTELMPSTLIIPSQIDEVKVTKIGDEAFYNRKELYTVKLADTDIISIGNSAFSNCSALTKLMLPVSITDIGNEAFAECTYLTDVYYLDTDEKWKNVLIGTSNECFSNATFHCGEYIDVSLLNFDKSTGTITGYNEYLVGKLIIPDKIDNVSVTSIGDEAFLYSEDLTEITIPDSVTSIGNSAFARCSSLTEITIPDTVTSIGNDAFSACSGLTEISISNNITEIEENTFSYCTALTQIAIPTGVKTIGKYSFLECTNLKTVNIPNTLTLIDYKAFEDCSNLADVYYDGTKYDWEEISISYNNSGLKNATVHFISEIIDEKVSLLKFDKSSGAITGCDKSISGELVIPTEIDNVRVTSISANAFQNCTNLKKITIPKSVKSIGKEAFYGCTGLTEVIMAKYLSTIGDSSFKNCTSLKKVTMYDSVTSIATSAFENCTSLTDITIPKNVKSIGVSAFANCSSLPKINIPKNLTNVPLSIFLGCSSMKSIVVDEENSQYSSIDGNLFNKEKNELLKYAAGKKDKEYTIPSGVTSIYDYAFEDSENITNITIPNGVTTLGNYSFANCTNLKAITIPYGVTTLTYSLFENCTNLKEVTIPNSVTKLEHNSFKNCTSLKEITIPNSITTLDDYLFANCTGLEKINLPDSLKSIELNIFDGCTNLTNVNVDENNLYYSSTDGNLFNKEKNKLIYYTLGKTDKEYIIPESVTAIGDNAFSGCTTLTQITIPDNVTVIGNGAFSDCTGLPQITIPEKVTDIGKSAFSGCTSLTDVTIPNNVTSLGEGYTFAYCDNLEQIRLSNNIRIIDDYTFINCHNLKRIVMPKSLTAIGDYVFHNCSQLKHIYYAGSENEWNSITYHPEVNDNSPVLKAIKHYNSLGYDKNDITSLIVFDEATGTIQAYDELIDGEIVIPAKIDGVPVTTIGENAFYYCTSLTDITIPNSVTSIDNYAFFSCTALKNITIPNSVTSIDNYAFGSCTNLTKITIPNTIDTIKYMTFSNCNNLSQIIIPKSVKTVEMFAFHFCESLTDVYYSGTQAEWNSIVIQQSSNNSLIKAKIHCMSSDMDTAKTPIPVTPTEIPSPTKTPITANPTENPPPIKTPIPVEPTKTPYSTQTPNDNNENKIEFEFDKERGIITSCNTKISGDVVIPSEIDGVVVMGIGANAFQGCKDLTGITIPNSVTTLGGAAFANCTALKQITIPDSIITIENDVFDFCSGLISITIPNSITNIGANAFEGCESLINVYYKGTEEEWNKIKINYNNDCLIGTTIHFSSPEPTIPIESISGTQELIGDFADKIEVECKADKNNITFTIKPKIGSVSDYKNIKLFVAGFDEKGNIFDKFITGENNFENDTLTLNANVPNTLGSKIGYIPYFV